MGVEQLGVGNPFDSAVVYFDPSAKAKGEKLAQLASKYLKLNPPTAQLVTFPQKLTRDQNAAKIFVDKSGIDAQLYISAPLQ